MASTSDSTTVPSRRQFFSSAACAGMAAAQPPIFTAAMFAADAALLALGAKFAELFAIASQAADLQTDAEMRCFDVLPACPVRPQANRFAWGIDYNAASKRFELERAEYDAKRAREEAEVGLAGLVEASRQADAAVRVIVAEAKETRATTLEGLIVKARIADQWDDQTMVASVMVDLLKAAA